MNKTDLNKLVNKLFCGDARKLLRALPDCSIDAVITDPMYGTAKSYSYSWGNEPSRGNPQSHWQYHQPIYEECLRVLKPGGVLAWAQGAKHASHFQSWFGDHRLWTLTRFSNGALKAIGNVWVVQTKEQQPIEFPPRDSLIRFNAQAVNFYRKYHPCPKPVEELLFMVGSLTSPGKIVLDCCCGIGSTLVAAEKLGRKWIGCDLSREYCHVALSRLVDPNFG